jgi:exodeoxyribonuclease-5
MFFKANGVADAVQIMREQQCFPAIVPTHEARVSINREFRRSLGLKQDCVNHNQPMMCLMNRPNMDIMNGEIFFVENASFGSRVRLRKEKEVDPNWSATAYLKPDFSEKPDTKCGPDCIPCCDAYAITCHKAQGSEWKNVAIIMNGSRFCQDTRWVYTAITRAAEKVSIIYC